jgi:CRISPR-associated protein Csa2
MSGAFLSVGVRAVVNVEALNMVESVGNVTRHRRATVVLRRGNSYVVRVVPAISGESVAHAYQWWVAELAKRRYAPGEAPLCEYCERGEFLKHCDLKLFGSKPWERELAKLLGAGEGKKEETEGEEAKKGRRSSKKAVYDPHEVEKTIVRNCVVEDIGGFLYPGDRPVKRTSRFQVSYMVPTMESLEAGAVAVEPQFHIRHSPTRAAREGEQEVAGQMMYYVETGSAVYALTFNLDAGSIGKTSMLRIEQVVDGEELRRRVELAVDALALMLDSRIFGAKLSRFTPIVEYEAVLAAVSNYPPFTVSSPALRSFAESTARRAAEYKKVFGEEVFLVGFGDGMPETVEKKDSLIELFSRVKELLLSKIEGRKERA